MNKKKVYENIMSSVAKEVKKVLNEGESFNQYSDAFKDLVKRVKSGNYAPEKADDDAQIIFDEFVPASDNCDTVAGEIMRACMRISYRWYNDGDFAGTGYGRETVNPAVRYLNAVVKKDDSPFSKVVSFFMDCIYDKGYFGDDDHYQEMCDKLLATTIPYIINKGLYEMANHEDMWDYRTDEDVDLPDYNDEEDEDWNEDEDWDEDGRY